jgi:hypothetical protein
LAEAKVGGQEVQAGEGGADLFNARPSAKFSRPTTGRRTVYSRRMDGRGSARRVARIAVIAASALVFLALGALAPAPASAAPWGFVRDFGMEGDGALRYPMGIAVGPTGHIYVADTGNNRVVRFDAEGRFVSAFGSKGTGPGQFDRPAGVAITSDGSVVVTDTYNHRVQKFTAAGTHLATWQPAAPDELRFPFGVAIGPGDVVHVANTGDGTIENAPEEILKLRASDGAVLGSFRGSGESRLSYPRTVAVDPAGYTYVGDDLRRILRFSPEGAFERSWRFPGGAFGLAIDPKVSYPSVPNQDLWATAGEGVLPPIGRYTPEGALTAEIGAVLPNPDPKMIFGPHSILRPQGIAAKGEDAIYVVDWVDSGRVIELRRRTSTTILENPREFVLPFRKFFPVSAGCGSGGSGGSRARATADTCVGEVQVRAEGELVADASFRSRVGRVVDVRLRPTPAGRSLGREEDRLRLNLRGVLKPEGRRAKVFKSRVLARDSARLSLACTRPQGDLGPIAVAGELSPELARRKVQVTYSGPGRTVIAPLRTDGEGDYAGSFTPDVPGAWTVWTRYAGDRTHSEALTEPCEVDVAVQSGGDAPPPPPPTDASLPDLVISDLTKDSFTVSNAGAAAAGSFVVRVVHAATGETQDFSFPGLAPGASETRGFFCFSGQVTASADPDNAVPEANDANNSAQRSVASCIG